MTDTASNPMEAAAKPLLGVATEGFARVLAAEIVGIWARETAANPPLWMIDAAASKLDVQWGYADPDGTIAREMAEAALRAALLALDGEER